MMGFGFCCCGGCEILGAHNDVTKAAFESHYTLTEGAAEPVWNGNVPTFSGYTGAKVTATGAKFADDNVGFQIAPSGVYSELRYTFKFGEIEYQYIWNYEQDEGATVPVRFQLLKGAAALFDSDEFPCYDLTAILNNTLAYIIRREDNSGSPRVCFYVGNHLIDRSEQPETLELNIPVEVSYSIEGSNYSLDSTNGFTHLFKPDKFWLFPENLPSDATQEQRAAGEREREGCAYPESCTAVWENSLPIIPPLKLTFSDWQDKRYIKSDTATNYADRVYKYGSLNNKYVAAGVAAACGFRTGAVRFSEHVRSFWVNNSKVTLVTTVLDANGNPIETSEIITEQSAMIADRTAYIYKKDDGPDYEAAASLVAAERILEITDEDDKAVVTVTGRIPYYDTDRDRAANHEAKFVGEIAKDAGETLIEWRDLIGAELTPDTETLETLAEHIGSEAKINIDYDIEARINTDSSCPSSVSARLILAAGLNGPARQEVVTESWSGGGNGYVCTGSKRWIAECSDIEKQATMKPMLDTSISLDPVYYTNEDGNEDICRILYYTNIEAIAVNGWTLEAEAIKYYKTDGSIYYDSSKIDGLVPRPAIEMGQAGALSVNDQHLESVESVHETARGTSSYFYVRAADNAHVPTLFSVTNFTHITYVMRPTGASEEENAPVFCTAHDAYELRSSTSGANRGCTFYVRLEALV